MQTEPRGSPRSAARFRNVSTAACPLSTVSFHFTGLGNVRPMLNAAIASTAAATKSLV
jgi:hypothetical protein